MTDYGQRLALEIDKRLRNRKTIRKYVDGGVHGYKIMDEQHPDASTTEDLISMVYMKIKDRGEGAIRRLFENGGTESSRGHYYETVAHDLLNTEWKAKRTELYRNGIRSDQIQDADVAEEMFFGVVEQAYRNRQRLPHGETVEHLFFDDGMERLQDLKWSEKPNAPQVGEMFTKIDYEKIKAFGDLSNLLRDGGYKKLRSGQRLLALDLIARIRRECHGEVFVDRHSVANFLGLNAHTVDRWRDDRKIRGRRIKGSHGKPVWAYDLIEVVETLLGVESDHAGL